MQKIFTNRKWADSSKLSASQKQGIGTRAAEGRIHGMMNTLATAVRRPVWARVYRLLQSQIETGGLFPGVREAFSCWKPSQ